MAHQKRTQAAEVVALRAAKALASPYMGNLAEWQQRLARLRVQRSGARISEAERLQVRVQLAELLDTVQHRRLDFRQALQDHPMIGALADLERSLDRLAEDLQQELRS